MSQPAIPTRSTASLGALVLLCLLVLACQRDEKPAAMTREPTEATVNAGKSIHSLTMQRLDGTDVALGSFAGKVLLIVNTASECGYTPQFEGLQALHTRYADQGFAVLGFPSNDFGGQEPGGPSEIATFCKARYGVTFPMFAKVETVGAKRSPLYTLLAAQGEPKWNFHKYLIDKHGVAKQAFPSSTRPDSAELQQAIQAALAAP